jgi:hypothetical protein
MMGTRALQVEGSKKESVAGRGSKLECSTPCKVAAKEYSPAQSSPLQMLK